MILHFFHYSLIVVLVLPHVEDDSYISVVTTKEAAAYSKRRNSKSTFVENLPYRSSSSFFFLATEFKRICLHISNWSLYVCFDLNDQGFFPHEVYRDWILLHQVQKDISLRRVPQKFVEKKGFKLSVKCVWLRLGNPNHVQVLLKAFGAKLACIWAHML